MPSAPRPSETQILLPLKPVKEIEIDGIGMGVLSDGTAYLTGAGLARMCGIAEPTIREIATNWPAEQFKPRGAKVADLLNSHGYTAGNLFVPITVQGATHHAYPDSVCMAFLEYYAFEAGTNVKEQAAKNYRLLARSSLKAFVYTQVGFDSKNRIPDSWRQFQDRVSLVYSKIPHGYFCIFKESADMVVTLIQGGVPVDNKTVPDISIGKTWSEHWAANCGDEKFAPRIKYEHNYPDYFPQSVSNPQPAWAYPESALPEFRRWMRETFLPHKLPGYLERQVKSRALPPSVASLVLEAVKPALLGNGPKVIAAGE